MCNFYLFLIHELPKISLTSSFPRFAPPPPPIENMVMPAGVQTFASDFAPK